MSELTRYRMLIDGDWVESTSGETFESRNPADNRDLIARFQAGNAADVARAVKAAEDAQRRWRRTPAPKRGETMYRFGELLSANKERLARAMTREMGKVLAEARGDVQEGIDIAFLMAGEGRRSFGDTVPSDVILADNARLENPNHGHVVTATNRDYGFRIGRKRADAPWVLVDASPNTGTGQFWEAFPAREAAESVYKSGLMLAFPGEALPDLVGDKEFVVTRVAKHDEGGESYLRQLGLPVPRRPAPAVRR